MTRLLLTLLALFTGLAAQISPVQARVCGGEGTEIGALQRSGNVIRVAVQASQRLGLAARQALPQRAASAAKLPQLRIAIPTVQIGSDRSLD
jgi:hypothetical protein